MNLKRRTFFVDLEIYLRFVELALYTRGAINLYRKKITFEIKMSKMLFVYEKLHVVHSE